MCGMAEMYAGVRWVWESYMRMGDGFVGDVGVSEWVSCG